jgi:hypothetical protein
MKKYYCIRESLPLGDMGVSQREHAKVCGDYATAVGNIPLWEAVKNYKRWRCGNGFNGDMLAIGLAYNANQPAGTAN